MKQNTKQSPQSRKKSQKKARDLTPTLYALGVCGVGLLITAVILLGVHLYRDRTYTVEIPPEDYEITDITESESTQTHADGSETTDKIYIVTVTYEADGVQYSDTLEMLTGTDTARKLYACYESGSGAEQVLGSIYYAPGKPEYIGRYQSESGS